ncbi:MAG: hypothetical protein IIV27_01780, partial [Clostridia bacterium]|nr:hypothetical protein [Clostridia bacterium]
MSLSILAGCDRPVNKEVNDGREQLTTVAAAVKSTEPKTKSTTKASATNKIFSTPSTQDLVKGYFNIIGNVPKGTAGASLKLAEAAVAAFQFAQNFGFLMAAVGSAVGLGNIWGFPAKMGANGGFTFLLVYIFLGLTTGIIVMISELAIGRKTGKGAVAAYQVVSKKFKWMGWMGIASAFLILFFYCALGGYCIKYVVVNVGDLFKAGFGSAGMTGA